MNYEGAMAANGFPRFDLSRFRTMSERPRAMHERWLHDWRSQREALQYKYKYIGSYLRCISNLIPPGQKLLEAVTEREMRVLTQKADTWHEAKIERKAWWNWRKMTRISWEEGKEARRVWRRQGLERFLRKWKFHTATQQRKVALNLLAWEHSRFALGRRVLKDMVAAGRACKAERARIAQMATARILVLKCKWRLLTWRSDTRRRRSERASIWRAMVGSGLRRWASFVVDARYNRRLHLLSLGLIRHSRLQRGVRALLHLARVNRPRVLLCRASAQRQAAKAMRVWRVELALRKRSNHGLRRTHRAQVAGALWRWARWARGKRHRRAEEEARARVATVQWYRTMIAGTMKHWYLRTCEAVNLTILAVEEERQREIQRHRVAQEQRSEHKEEDLTGGEDETDEEALRPSSTPPYGVTVVFPAASAHRSGSERTQRQ